MNLLYVGIYNPIEVDAPKGAIIKASDGLELFKKSESLYLAMPDGSEMSVSISVLHDSAQSTKPIYRHIFRVREIPSPVCQLGGLRNGNDAVPISQLRAQKVLTSQLDGFPYALDFYIQSFTVTCFYSSMGHEEYSTNITGAKLSAELLEMIKKLKSGDRLIFENIKVKEKTFGIERTAMPLVLRVK